MNETMRDDGWACVAVFEFPHAAPERRVLRLGTEQECLRLSDRLDQAAAAGRGLKYDGDREEPPLYALTAVCRASALEDPPAALERP